MISDLCGFKWLTHWATGSIPTEHVCALPKDHEEDYHWCFCGVEIKVEQ